MWLLLGSLSMQAQIQQGDVNNDGSVSIDDVAVLIDYLLTERPNQVNVAAADIDNDGHVTIDDLASLIDILLRGPQYDIVIVDVTSTVKVRMVRVAGGTYWMGSTDGNASQWETPVHKVTVPDFTIGETEVTQELWQAVMGNNPSRFTGNLKRPVEGVNWNDCQQFITRLNAMTGKRFRLPSEAEWEFAARGGSKSKDYPYAGSDDIDRVAWWGYNIKGGDCTTHPVGTLAPNELGILDMSGNVWEWCQDWFAPYDSQEQVNPSGPATGKSKVLRGGGWSGESRYCRTSERFHFAPTLRGDLIGMRLAL